MITALLRLTEPNSGRIVIDDVDIHTVGLQLLRSSISVISQDTVLLDGTIKYNLDPFQECDDDWLGQCLHMVGLGDEDSGKTTKVEAGSDSKRCNDHSALNLEFEVKENGANISHGQRALISIARSLVKRSKIVILDEATASVDTLTEQLIQAALQKYKDNKLFTQQISNGLTSLSAEHLAVVWSI